MIARAATCEMRVRAACAFALALALAGVPPARADEVPGDLGTITVTARLPRPLAEAAAAVTVVDAATLDALLVRDLGDLARYEPGLAVRRDATRFGADDFSIRGIGGNRVLVEVDGVPAPPAFSIGSFADTGRSYLDLDLASRVEVLRGPASSLYGSDALGGVVSVRSWSPRDLLGSEPFAVRARAAWRGDDHGRLLGTVGAVRHGESRALLAYSAREAGEFETASRIVQPNPRTARSRAWLAKLEHGDEHPLRLVVDRQDRSQITDVRSLVLQPGRYANTTAMRGDDAGQSTRVSLEQSYVDVGPVATAEWRIYVRDSTVRQETFERRRAAGAAPASTVFRGFRFDATVVGLQATAGVELDAGRMHHDVVTGFEVDRSRLEELRDGLQTSVPSGAATKIILGESFPLRDFPRTVVTRAGVHVQDRVAPEGSRFAWIPALRVDHYRLRPETDAVYAEDNPRTAPVAVTRTSISPRLGGTWTVNDRWTLYAQYAHGFRAPPFQDVNVGLDLPQIATRAIPNPDLKSERSDGLEIGARAERGPMRGSISAFYNRYRDFIESKVNLGRDATGTTIFQSRNVARARIAGVEVAGTWALGERMPRLEGVVLRAAYYGARGDDTSRDRPLNSVEPAKAVLGATYAGRSGAWGLGLTGVAVAAKRRIDDGSTTLARAPGHVTLDLDAYWRPAAGLELRAAVTNATDRSYFEWADVQGRAATDPALELYRRPGRTLSFAATYRY